MNEKIFALDIGTRSVVGIIMEKADDSFRVVDLVTREHEERSMLDGQIHDVLSVSRVIEEVKNELEHHHGPLHKVCVAAAGRALRTCRTSIQKDVYHQPLMTDEDVSHLELTAVQQAQYEIAQESYDAKTTDYYCVGYSVLHYYLDDQAIGSLVDQQGKEVRVDIIATFLPKVVVESLLSALQRAGLEMDALTLEPIAAIQVLIPQSMRRLNVALVDIGAGTSDIALTDEGTVTAYGMVPVAGDEITEAISDAYLLDFPLAEKAKRELTSIQSTKVTDILGFETTVTLDEVVEEVKPSIESLAQRIADEILLLNGKAPKAVMLVGGGSQTPSLTEKLSEKLQLPFNRVAIRGIDAIQNLQEKEQLPQGPDFVTPIGIAIAAKQSPVHYISIQVNNRYIRLFDMKTLTVGDALLAAGIDFTQLYGKPGQAYMIKVNDKAVPLKGSYGKGPTLKVNGDSKPIDTQVLHGDTIEVEQGLDGEPPSITTEDLIGDLSDIKLNFNGKDYSFTSPLVYINNLKASQSQVIKDSDRIEHYPLNTIADLMRALKREDEWVDQSEEPIIYLNQTRLPFHANGHGLTRNGEKASMMSSIQDGDTLRYTLTPESTLEAILHHNGITLFEKADIFFDGQPVQLKKQKMTVKRDGRVLQPEDSVKPGDSLQSEDQNTAPFIYQDVFRYVDIDLESVPRPFQLYRNDEEASFYEPIHPGDRLSIGIKTRA
ncbi:cell division protein FtsA [Halobacillus salinus]|uniref:Cell division protein FtsA n=1 Tax=Halobacillus salinus TaxID=192814 RepID=A0A4Z0H0U0_9BACI|nr:cell division protein FtsA [Halobacillus salinus]TGB04032.1 cell division protein FtsA [Halobacillus salinus]